MRCILGLCAVVAIGSSAWVAEMGGIARGAEYQTPGAATGAPVIQPPAIPTVPAASPAAVMYQGTTAQPAATSTMPAPNMMPSGTYTAPMQSTTNLAAPGSNMTYPAYSYRAGSTGPVYYAPTPVTATYGTPVQGYATMPAQPNYAPVRRRFPFGLFQRWRQQAQPTYTTMPGYTSPVYTYPRYTTMPAATPMYTTGVYMSPGVRSGNYAMGSYTTPVYYPTTYTLPAGTMPAGVATNTVAPATTTAPSQTPVYSPTMLNVPNSPTNTGAPAAGAAPANTQAEDASPVPNVPNPPGATQGAGATPARSIPPPPTIPTPAATGNSPN